VPELIQCTGRTESMETSSLVWAGVLVPHGRLLYTRIWLIIIWTLTL
jgi:hypothetical protein